MSDHHETQEQQQHEEEPAPQTAASRGSWKIEDSKLARRRAQSNRETTTSRPDTLELMVPSVSNRAARLSNPTTDSDAAYIDLLLTRFSKPDGPYTHVFESVSMFDTRSTASSHQGGDIRPNYLRSISDSVERRSHSNSRQSSHATKLPDALKLPQGQPIVFESTTAESKIGVSQTKLVNISNSVQSQRTFVIRKSTLV
jgi:hypothetical protein